MKNTVFSKFAWIRVNNFDNFDSAEWFHLKNTSLKFASYVAVPKMYSWENLASWKMVEMAIKLLSIKINCFFFVLAKSG